MRKNKSKKTLKRFVISETQQQLLIRGCQESPLTVAEYAKANKVAPSSLYRWAELAGVSLKSTKKKTDKKKPGDKRQMTLNGHGSKRIKTEEQEPPKLDLGYIVKEFLAVIKEMAKGVIRWISSKNHH